MKLRWVVNFIVFTLICVVTILGLATRDAAVAADVSVDKIEGLLIDQLTTDGSADYIIRFSKQADLSPAYSMDWDARGVFVYNTLQDTAERAQKNAKIILDAQGLNYQTFFAGNDLYVWGGNQAATTELATMNELAALPEVEFIRAPRTYSIDPIEVTTPFQNIIWAGDYLATNALTTVGESINATVDWGIIDTKADQFWTRFGVKGAGIKVANIDTGVQWNHPGLINQFACPGDPTNPACWKDPKDICPAGACDNNGHGTHTMGTMVAADDPGLPFIAGMAPDATWIACKGCESASCSDSALMACADWILAPGGSAANRPNVVNNSWGGPGNNPWYLANVIAWRAAGIFPAFSAGNSGSGCSTLGSPGDYQESFGSAAHDSSRNIAYFSSRGPSAFGHEPYTKPNISAPGVAICSTVPTNGWNCGYSGTSMASPHTAGAVALLWSCNPAMVGQIDATLQLLQNNADLAPAGNCGAPPDGQGNYTYGSGYLNVLAAGLTTCSGFEKGTLDGYIRDQEGRPISAASVSAQIATQGNVINVTTDPSGFYTMTLIAGTYNLTAAKANFSSQTVTGIGIAANHTTVQDFQLTYVGAWTRIGLPANCPDWTRFDGEYYPGDGFVYFMGGRGGTAGDITYGDVIKFDPATHTCADTGINMPVPVSNYTISLVNNGTDDVLCTFGGRDSSGTSTLTAQCYNPVSHTTSVLKDLPLAYTGYTPGAQVVVDNMVYIFGGFSSLAPYNLARTDQYNPLTNSYKQLGDLSQARSYIDAAVVDGKIYAFGGNVYDGANLVAQTRAEVMADPGGAGTWDNAAVVDLPTASAEGCAYGFNTGSPDTLAGKIVLAGGGQWPGDTSEVLSYNTVTDSYNTNFPNLNVSRRDQAGFIIPTIPGTIWVFGGRSGSDIPPYAPPEYHGIRLWNVYLPLIFNHPR